MSDRPQVIVVTGTRGEEVAERIADAGVDVEAVDDLEGARAALADGTFDCVVSDTEVADGGERVDGVDVLRSIRDAAGDLPTVLFGDEGQVAEEAVAAGIADHVPLGSGEDAYDHLVGRVRNAVARRQAVRRAEQQARTNEVIRDVNQALVRADSREVIEETVCERLVRSEQYTFAWIAYVGEDGISLRALGVDGSAVEGRGAISVDEGTAFTEPVRRAARDRSVVVVRDVEDRGGVWEAALDRSFEAVAAVPAVYEDRVYGVLVVYADRHGAFDVQERRVLSELGENIAYAMNAVALRRQMRLRERELRRQNERLEEFASVVSHDLRNPLTVARGYLETVEDEPAVTEALSSLDRMETIVEDVLELARQGGTIGETDPVDLQRAAIEAWGNVDTGDASLEVVEDATVEADYGRLARMLENLFRNARDHADADEVRVGPLTEDGGSVGFFVEDDGPGIPDDERDEVFEMGYTNSEDGTGFGLSIVSEVAEAHGWRHRVAEGDDGARFEFTGVDEPGSGPPTDGPETV